VDVSNKDTQFLHKVIDALSWVIIHNNCEQIVNQGLVQLMISEVIVPKTLSDLHIVDLNPFEPYSINSKEIGKKRSSATSPNEKADRKTSIEEQRHWLASVDNGSASSLLSVPLLDFLVLAIALAQVGDVKGLKDAVIVTGSGGVYAVASCYPWLCVARLVQIMITHLPFLLKLTWLW